MTWICGQPSAPLGRCFVPSKGVEHQTIGFAVADQTDRVVFAVVPRILRGVGDGDPDDALAGGRVELGDRTVDDRLPVDVVIRCLGELGERALVQLLVGTDASVRAGLGPSDGSAVAASVVTVAPRQEAPQPRPVQPQRTVRPPPAPPVERAGGSGQRTGAGPLRRDSRRDARMTSRMPMTPSPAPSSGPRARNRAPGCSPCRRSRSPGGRTESSGGQFIRAVRGTASSTRS